MKKIIIAFMTILLVFALIPKQSFAYRAEDVKGNNMALLSETGVTIGYLREIYTLGLEEDKYIIKIREKDDINYWFLFMNLPPEIPFSTEMAYLFSIQFDIENGDGLLESGINWAQFERIRIIILDKLLKNLKPASNKISQKEFDQLENYIDDYFENLKKLADNSANYDEVYKKLHTITENIFNLYLYMLTEESWTNQFDSNSELNLATTQKVQMLLEYAFLSADEGEWRGKDYYVKNKRVMGIRNSFDSTGFQELHVYKGAKLRNIIEDSTSVVLAPELTRGALQQVAYDLYQVVDGNDKTKPNGPYAEYVTALYEDYQISKIEDYKKEVDEAISLGDLKTAHSKIDTIIELIDQHREKYEQKFPTYPSLAEWYMKKGNLYLDENDGNQSITAFRSAVEISSYSVATREAMLYALVKLKRYEEAYNFIGEYEKEQIYIDASFGNALLDARQYEILIEFMNKSIKNKPNFMNYLVKGKAYTGMAECTLAKETFEDALKFAVNDFQKAMVLEVKNQVCLKYRQNVMKKEPVPIDKVWKVIFTTQIDERMIHEGNIKIHDEKGNQISNLVLELSADKKEVLVKNPLDYELDTTYYLTIENLYAVNGKRLYRNVKMTFETMDIVEKKIYDLENNPEDNGFVLDEAKQFNMLGKDYNNVVAVYHKPKGLYETETLVKVFSYDDKEKQWDIIYKKIFSRDYYLTVSGNLLFDETEQIVITRKEGSGQFLSFNVIGSKDGETVTDLFDKTAENYFQGDVKIADHKLVTYSGSETFYYTWNGKQFEDESKGPNLNIPEGSIVIRYKINDNHVIESNYQNEHSFDVDQGQRIYLIREDSGASERIMMSGRIEVVEPGVFEIIGNGRVEIKIIPGGYDWDMAYTYYFK